MSAMANRVFLDWCHSNVPGQWPQVVFAYPFHIGNPDFRLIFHAKSGYPDFIRIFMCRSI